jgi:hypothetical protein
VNGTIPPGEYAVVTQEGPREAAALWDFDPAYVSSGVKLRKSHSEHFSTAVPQKADVVLTAANGSFVPQHKIATR